MAKLIEIKDWANKNQNFYYTADMKPVGMIECVCAVEWRVCDADGNFINDFTSKKEAKAALQ